MAQRDGGAAQAYPAGATLEQPAGGRGDGRRSRAAHSAGCRPRAGTPTGHARASHAAVGGSVPASGPPSAHGVPDGRQAARRHSQRRHTPPSFPAGATNGQAIHSASPLNVSAALSPCTDRGRLVADLRHCAKLWKHETHRILEHQSLLYMFLTQSAVRLTSVTEARHRLPRVPPPTRPYPPQWSPAPLKLPAAPAKLMALRCAPTPAASGGRGPATRSTPPHMRGTPQWGRAQCTAGQAGRGRQCGRKSRPPPPA